MRSSSTTEVDIGTGGDWHCLGDKEIVVENAVPEDRPSRDHFETCRGTIRDTAGTKEDKRGCNCSGNVTSHWHTRGVQLLGNTSGKRMATGPPGSGCACTTIL